MPRPGPRPYECVRRAWHSDRHKPMRGSIIQQIFRVAYETHSAVTKKNREWQEKLPLVVFKAEEIMYSKANSEAEYMNLETIWDRVNDAINTIIRRDETTETGELLPPCIEAALNLGCIPVRASRSQRHSNPRTYLSPRMQEPASVSPRVLDTTSKEQRPQLSQLHSAKPVTFARTAGPANSTLPISESNRRLTDNAHAGAPHSYPLRCENIAPGGNVLRTKENDSRLNLASVYPLYYVNQNQVQESMLGSQVPTNMNSSNVLVGEPIGISVAEPAKMGVLQNFFNSSGAEIVPTRIIEPEIRNTLEKPPGFGGECDLSLRLGPLSEHCMRGPQETEHVGSSSYQDRGHYRVSSSQKNKEFCFFPG
ncbi:hypothetical protein Tsubulata_007757 [Turnera subulata]|uniref:Histone acetyltransferase n=1 Tax=Turnera subulata TaxID=218843 RepID=A0A9Q0FZJ9_9ROSI|nr:hypothetical protein Tsubulata_007757 [Turnera subulata]